VHEKPQAPTWINNMNIVSPLKIDVSKPYPVIVPEPGLDKAMFQFTIIEDKLYSRRSGRRASYRSCDGNRYVHFGSVGHGKLKKMLEEDVIQLLREWNYA